MPIIHFELMQCFKKNYFPSTMKSDSSREKRNAKIVGVRQKYTSHFLSKMSERRQQRTSTLLSSPSIFSLWSYCTTKAYWYIYIYISEKPQDFSRHYRLEKPWENSVEISSDFTTEIVIEHYHRGRIPTKIHCTLGIPTKYTAGLEYVPNVHKTSV